MHFSSVYIKEKAIFRKMIQILESINLTKYRTVKVRGFFYSSKIQIRNGHILGNITIEIRIFYKEMFSSFLCGAEAVFKMRFYGKR